MLATTEQAEATAKVCSVCGLTKSREEFSGRMAQCKVCNASRVRGERAEHPERVRTRDRARVRDTTAYKAAWYQRNRAAMDERSRAWAETNRERRREISSAHAKRKRRENPEWARDHDRLLNLARKARVRGAERKVITNRDLVRLADRQRDLCAYCNEQRPLTVEHVIPLARGGRHAIGNLVLACTPCNSSKRDRLLIEWRS